jgi:hypothetical protein
MIPYDRGADRLPNRAYWWRGTGSADRALRSDAFRPPRRAPAYVRSGFGLLPIPLLERRLQRTQFIPIDRVLIRPLRPWARQMPPRSRAISACATSGEISQA